MLSVLRKLLKLFIRIDYRRHEDLCDECLPAYQVEHRSLLDSSKLVTGRCNEFEKIEVPCMSLGSVKNVFVVHSPMVIISDKGFVFEHLMNNEYSLRFVNKLNFIYFFLLSGFTKNQRHSTQIKIVLSTQWSENYFHWTIETVPKLLFIREFALKCNIKILMTDSNYDYVKEWLSYLEIPDQLIEYPTKKTSFFNTAYFFRFHRNKGYTHSEVIKSLRGFSEKKFKLYHEHKLKIYISRNDSQIRRVINEKEICDFLVKKGFQVLSLSKMSVKSQAQVFSKACYIIAPHGAGLVNIIHCLPQTKILEFLPRKNSNFCYSRLSQDLSLSYNSLYCEVHHGNFVVDLEKIKNLFS